MKITIDNLDGKGALDHTGALSGEAPAIIERKLNQPSRCVVNLMPEGDAPPVSGARIVVNADGGTTLFSGYAINTPAYVYAGMKTEGPVYSLQVECVSDEVMLDARVSERTLDCVATDIGDLLVKITSRASAQSLPASGDALSALIGGYQALAGKSWSTNVGALCNAARACYRVVNAAVQFSNVGDQVHRFAESDNSLDRGSLRGSRVRQVVNDITVCGPVEPQTYVTEIFEGDGVTSVFELSEPSLLEKATGLADTFSGTVIDPQRWAVVDGGGYTSVTARGLTIGGGQGGNGNSSVIGVDALEMGGVILLELSGLQIDADGEGYLACLCNGTFSAANIMAGFHLRANGTSVVAAPIVLGVEAGSTTTLQIGHTYTLRLRFHCKDRQRALQSYSAGGINGAVRLGGQILSADGDLVLEIQETTGGVITAPVVLFDGSVAQAPTSCTPVVIDSIGFLGSIASFEITRPGDFWVRCTANGSAATTQRLGTSAQEAQAKLTGTERLSFFPGSVPAANTTITACYRLGGRAVARMTVPTPSASSSLILTAEHPLTRTSADCENAALALLSVSTWPNAAWKGTYACWNPQQTVDIWPGDVLQVEAPSTNTSSELIVRNVQIHATSCVPELLHYTIQFANEWGEPLSLKMAEAAPLNAWLPPMALTASTALASLRDLVVTSVTATQIQLQANMTAPNGGGFEVRRSDWKFGAGDGADLVLRSPASSFAIVREAPVERYYVRMYDGATPPNYSRFSSAIFVNAATQ